MHNFVYEVSDQELNEVAGTYRIAIDSDPRSDGGVGGGGGVANGAGMLNSSGED